MLWNTAHDHQYVHGNSTESFGQMPAGSTPPPPTMANPKICQKTLV